MARSASGSSGGTRRRRASRRPCGRSPCRALSDSTIQSRQRQMCGWLSRTCCPVARPSRCTARRPSSAGPSARRTAGAPAGGRRPSRRRRGDASSRKACSSSGVGGRPIRSRYTRRSSTALGASGRGFRPRCSCSAATNASIGLRTQPAFLTAGTARPLHRLERLPGVVRPGPPARRRAFWAPRPARPGWARRSIRPASGRRASRRGWGRRRCRCPRRRARRGPPGCRSGQPRLAALLRHSATRLPNALCGFPSSSAVSGRWQVRQSLTALARRGRRSRPGPSGVPAWPGSERSGGAKRLRREGRCAYGVRRGGGQAGCVYDDRTGSRSQGQRRSRRLAAGPVSLPGPSTSFLGGTLWDILGHSLVQAARPQPKDPFSGPAFCDTLQARRPARRPQPGGGAAPGAGHFFLGVTEADISGHPGGPAAAARSAPPCTYCGPAQNGRQKSVGRPDSGGRPGLRSRTADPRPWRRANGRVR